MKLMGKYHELYQIKNKVIIVSYELSWVLMLIKQCSINLLTLYLFDHLQCQIVNHQYFITGFKLKKQTFLCNKVIDIKTFPYPNE